MAGQLAANCTVRGYTDTTVDLALSPEHGQLLTASTRAKLESALGDHFGRPMRLRVDVAPRSEASPESPAERGVREESERRERASRQIDEVPDYQDLLARFEGNTRSIHPPD